jgi:hypothetical protein
MISTERKSTSRFIALVGILLFLLLLASTGVAWGGEAEAQTVFTATNTPSRTPTMTWTPSVTPTITPTGTITPTPSESPVPSPTVGVTPLLITPEPTLAPLATPTPEPGGLGSTLGSILPWLILTVLVIIIAGGVAAFVILRSRSEGEV